MNRSEQTKAASQKSNHEIDKVEKKQKQLIKEGKTRSNQRTIGKFRKGFYLTIPVALILIITAVFTFQSFAVQASDRFGPLGSTNQIIEEMRGRLDLSAEQEADISPIIDAMVRKRNELMKKAKNDRRAMRSTMQDLQFETDMKLGEVLTKEQMEEYTKMKEEQRKEMPGGDSHGGRKGGGKGRRF